MLLQLQVTTGVAFPIGATAGKQTVQIQAEQHFCQPRTDVERVNATDFEQYIGADELAVHIGVHQLAPS